MPDRDFERALPPEEAYLKLERYSPGETVVRGRLFETSDFKYDTDVERIGMEQVIAPVYVNGTEVIIRMLQKPKFYMKGGAEITSSKEDEERIGVTWIHIGGAASQDDPHIGDLVVRLEKAARESKVKLNNVVLLGHPIAAPKTGHGSKGFDREDFSDSAEALQQALANPEIKISGKVIITGISAGAGPATALAASNPDIDVLVLMDPAGMGDHPGLGIKFAVKDPMEEYSHLRDKKTPRWQAFKETWHGLAKSMSTGKGVPTNIVKLVGAFFPDETHHRIAKAYGIEGDSGKSGLNMKLLSRDSSERFREKLGVNNELAVVVSPAMAGSVVNFLRVRNGWSDAEVSEALRNPKGDTAKMLHNQGESTLQKMFPAVSRKKLHLLPWWGKSHMSVASEQAYMDRVVAKVEEILS